MLIALVIVMFASTLSALSGVGKGIKWLSNINMGLWFFILAFFYVFSSTMFALSSFFTSIWDYIIALPAMYMTVWSPDSDAKSVISKLAGGTAIDLTLNGGAGDQITGSGLSSQLFAIINFMLSPALATLMSMVIVVLLITYLMTSADSAVLIINTIAAAGDESPKGRVHIVTWGVILTLVIGSLLMTSGDGLGAINTTMITGALPFSVVMALIGLSLLKALIRGGMRENENNGG